VSNLLNNLIPVNEKKKRSWQTDLISTSIQAMNFYAWNENTFKELATFSTHINLKKLVDLLRGGRSVDIVHLKTKGQGVFFVFVDPLLH
jgi:hypothetical protein